MAIERATRALCGQIDDARITAGQLRRRCDQALAAGAAEERTRISAAFGELDQEFAVIALLCERVDGGFWLMQALAQTCALTPHLERRLREREAGIRAIEDAAGIETELAA